MNSFAVNIKHSGVTGKWLCRVSHFETGCKCIDWIELSCIRQILRVNGSLKSYLIMCQDMSTRRAPGHNIYSQMMAIWSAICTQNRSHCNINRALLDTANQNREHVAKCKNNTLAELMNGRSTAQ